MGVGVKVKRKKLMGFLLLLITSVGFLRTTLLFTVLCVLDRNSSSSIVLFHKLTLAFLRALIRHLINNFVIVLFL
jgi:hypothetical protein